MVADIERLFFSKSLDPPPVLIVVNRCFIRFIRKSHFGLTNTLALIKSFGKIIINSKYNGVLYKMQRLPAFFFRKLLKNLLHLV